MCIDGLSSITKEWKNCTKPVQKNQQSIDEIIQEESVESMQRPIAKNLHQAVEELEMPYDFGCTIPISSYFSIIQRLGDLKTVFISQLKGII